MIITNNKITTFFKKLVSTEKATGTYEVPKLLPHIKKPPLEFSPITDIFQKQDYQNVVANLKNDVPTSHLADCILRENPMNEETYSALSPEKLEAIRAQLKPYMVNDAQYLVPAAKTVKTIFDTNYGEGKYTFVSIGRSLSALTNCLKFLGVETKQIPLSGCGGYKYPEETVNIMIYQPGFNGYKQFLEKTIPKDNDKIYIFGDYASTGTTLNTFKLFLNHPKVNLGRKNDKFVAVNDLMREFAEYEPDTQHYARNLEDYLYRQRFDEYSEVKPLNYKELDNISYSLQPTNHRSNKLMKFCMLDMLKGEKQ